MQRAKIRVRVVHNAPPSINHPLSKQQVATHVLQNHMQTNQQVAATPQTQAHSILIKLFALALTKQQL